MRANCVVESGKEENNVIRRKKNRVAIVESLIMCVALSVCTGRADVYSKTDIREVYGEYIRDKILPEIGYADLEKGSKSVSEETAVNLAGWKERSGLLGAEVADLDGDGTEELLVYSFGGQEQKKDNEGENYGTLYLDLYEGKDGEVKLISSTPVFASSDVELSSVYAGKMEVEDRVYLYMEWISEASFSHDGGDSGYVWMTYDGKELSPVWNIRQTGDQEQGILYSLLTRQEDGSYEEAALWADDSYREKHTDVFVYTIQGSSLTEAVKMGFQIIGLPDAAEGTSGYLYETMPSYVNSEYFKPSVSYVCIGSEEGEAGNRQMTVNAEDFTGVREWMEELGEAETESEMESETEEETESEIET